jgi:redox-sensitive bicupin YhaK (pirin superfamily)
MIEMRRAEDRGRTRLDWLDSRHTFSFADYMDRAQMGFSVLRVINDDRVTPGGGFPPHCHQDMEIISYVLDGALEHKDSLGNTSVIRRGEVQRMSAGRGVSHSEFNASNTHPVHFLQIWILPGRQGMAPGYEQKRLAAEGQAGRWCLAASPDGREDSVTIHQDVLLFVTALRNGDSIEFAVRPGRRVYLHQALGSTQVNGESLAEGDGMKVVAEARLAIKALSAAELLIFDLP